MKKNWKHLAAGGAALTLLAGMLAVPTLASTGSRTARLDYQNMKVTLDGQVLNLTDSTGAPVEPFTINGTTYLPLATIGRVLGLDVSWDGSTNTVVLSTGTTSAGGGTSVTDGSRNYIGAQQAKSIALNHAGVSASSASFVRTQLDYEDGRRVYEVEFYSGNREYDYEIDAATGDIVSYDFDAEYYNPQRPQTGTMLTEAQVKAIVEARAGTTGTYREFKLDRDDGRIVYEGELRSGWTEYEFTVDAYSGTILEWSLD